MKWLILFISLVHLTSFAAEVPRELPLGTSNFTFHALGEACFAMETSIDGLPCNPAFTARERKTQFQTHFFFGNNISYIRDVSAVIDDQADQQTFERLFNQKRSSEMEANIEAGYLREKFGFAFSPYRISYYSLIRNTSLPVITLYAAQEQSIKTQFASYLDQDFYFGLQLRGVQRKFVLTEFTLTDALVEDAREDIFRIQEQRALYFEPSLLWAPEDKSWSPQVSLGITQLGAVDRKVEQFPASPQGHIGGSIKPPISFGVMELGTTFTMRSQYEKWTELFRWAASYKLGATQYMGSFTDNQYALAFLIKYKAIRGGLTYDYKKFENLVGEMDNVKTIYLQIGAEI